MTDGANITRLTRDEGQASLARSFEHCAFKLAKMDVRQNRLGYTHCSQIIRAHCEQNWELRFREIEGFFTNSAQRTLELSPTFGELLANTTYRIENSQDRSVIEALEVLGDPKETISDLLMGLFVAHELLHIEQGLGSYQYRDSGYYMQAVSLIDYQADISAMDAVINALYAQESAETQRAALYIMTVIHIRVMQHFSPSKDSGVLDALALDRLLVWHFHAARLARLVQLPDLTHPGFSQMPVISIPNLTRITASKGTVEKSDLDELTNKPPGDLRVDLVAASHRGDGVAEISRETFTTPERVRDIVEGILTESFRQTREALEEFLTKNRNLFIFEKADRTNARVAIFSRSIELADVVLELDEDVLNNQAADVVRLYQLVEHLIEEKMVGGAWWQQYADDLDDGILDSRWARWPAKAQAASLRTDIVKISTRLNLRLDEFIQRTGVVG